MPAPTKVIAEKHLILGEGDGDEAFFRHLCSVRAIQGFGFDHVSGNGDFERYLKALGTQAPLESILIVADNDEEPDNKFRNVQRQIVRAKLPQPNYALHKASRLGDPHIVVLMIPYPPIGNSHGALETLLLPAVEQHLPAQTACVDQYSQCILSGGEHWTRTERDKMRLRCLLSGSYKTDPNIGLQYALKPDKNLVPLSHATFDPLAHLLSHFIEWMESPHTNWDAWRVQNP